MQRAYLVALVLVVIGVFASASLDWLRSTARFAVTPAGPLDRVSTKSEGFFASLRDVNALRSQVASLESENAQLEAQLVALQEVVARDERLQAALAKSTSMPQEQLLAARVIAHSPMRALDELVVDQGSDDGVVAGRPVLKDGFLVGIVDQVSGSTSTVTLLTSSRTTLPVLLSQSRAQGILRGGLRGLVVTDLPIDVQVGEGETVLTSALGELLPPDIPVGRTGAIVSAESEILQRVTLSSPVKFSALEEVLIVRAEGAS